jgi:hypothetical protein
MKKNKIYGIFLVKKNSEIYGINYGLNFLFLSKNKVKLIFDEKMVDIILKKANKKFPKLLKNNSKIVPIRLTKKFYPLPIKLDYLYKNNKVIKFEKLKIVERRKRKLKNICSC